MNPPSPSYSLTGGARIGWMNCSWPLATLTVTADRLTISTTMFGLFSLGTYSFTKDQIVSMEPCGMISKGIRIVHSIPEFPRSIIFWGNPQKLLAEIAAVGFVPSPSSGFPQLPLVGTAKGIPVRWTPMIVLGVIWNALIIYGSPTQSPAADTDFGLPMLLPVGLFFTISMATLFSPAVQRVFMKPGRHFGEVRSVFLLVAFITGIMTVVSGLMFVMPMLNPSHPKPMGAPDPTAASER